MLTKIQAAANLAHMKKNILITGASTGIGFATAGEWAKKGHQVFAGVRRAEDAERLKTENSSIQTLILDVTKTAEIQDSLKRVQDILQTTGTEELPFILVNNAGIALAGPIECLPMKEFRLQFDVNFFGVIETTQMFLPLVRRTEGRVINISSISGRLAAPFLGPYSASKFALEGLTDSLRRELAPLGVKVSLVEPGPIQTPIWEKGLAVKDQIVKTMPGEALKYYEKRLAKFIEFTAKSARNADPVELVIKALDHAAFSEKPKARYFVGRNAQAGNMVSRLPTSWVDGLIRLSSKGL